MGKRTMQEVEMATKRFLLIEVRELDSGYIVKSSRYTRFDSSLDFDGEELAVVDDYLSIQGEVAGLVEAWRKAGDA